MIYKELYLKCNTIDELILMARKDLTFAMLINKDKVKAIENAINETVNKKGWDINKVTKECEKIKGTR